VGGEHPAPDLELVEALVQHERGQVIDTDPRRLLEETLEALDQVDQETERQ
jgi:hypothetical protein